MLSHDVIYTGGYYHGKLVFPPDYPFKPPRISMITPNGRFGTNKRSVYQLVIFTQTLGTLLGQWLQYSLAC